MTETQHERRYFVGENTRVVLLYDADGILTGYELYPKDSPEYFALLAEHIGEEGAM